jgi:predicted metal-binding membrane protein
MTTAALPIPYSRWRLLLWRHPESWALLLSAGAWLFFIATSGSDWALHSVAPLAHAGHTGYSHGPSSALALHWSIMWSIMIAAMMFPPLIGHLRVVAARSFWSRRHRAMILFLSGYSALWLLYGFGAEAGLQLQRSISPAASGFAIPLTFLMAAGWQLTPQKRRSLIACHFTMPLAPSGWRADFDCYRYGFRTAASCCISCWALMFACAAAGHALWAMLAVTSVSWSERFLRRPRQLWLSLALFAVALLAKYTVS